MASSAISGLGQTIPRACLQLWQEHPPAPCSTGSGSPCSLLAVLVGGFTGKLPDDDERRVRNGRDGGDGDRAAAGRASWRSGSASCGSRSARGSCQIIARALRPVMRRLFPDVPPEHPAMGAMVMNMAANMLGLGNAATPLGLRAMQHPRALNPRPGAATNAMCTFLAINTASIQLVPTTAIGFLAVAGSKNPRRLSSTAFLATCCAACSRRACGEAPRAAADLRVSAADPAKASQARCSAAPVVADGARRGDKCDPPPSHARGRVALGFFVSAFVAMFVVLAFPDAVNAALAGRSVSACGLRRPPELMSRKRSDPARRSSPSRCSPCRFCSLSFRSTRRCAG